MDGRLGVLDRSNGAVELMPPAQKHAALRGQHRGKAAALTPDDLGDLLQRKAEKAQGDDLLQPLQMAGRVDTVAGRCALRLEQPIRS